MNLHEITNISPAMTRIQVHSLINFFSFLVVFISCELWLPEVYCSCVSLFITMGKCPISKRRAILPLWILKDKWILWAEHQPVWKEWVTTGELTSQVKPQALPGPRCLRNSAYHSHMAGWPMLNCCSCGSCSPLGFKAVILIPAIIIKLERLRL